ncbi:hypothetical protein QE152_g34437 [Popillia japonica]|uniref:Retrotransposon gag domain-containing protein n=1 Tax=Popillia japonica TaxID=7064 RepID=A0AAW1IT24_POPJA
MPGREEGIDVMLEKLRLDVYVTIYEDTPQTTTTLRSGIKAIEPIQIKLKAIHIEVKKRKNGWREKWRIAMWELQILKTLQRIITVKLKATRVRQLMKNQEHNSTTPVRDNNIRNFNIMPDLSKSIDNFAGEGSPKLAIKWLEQLKSTAALHSWLEPFTLQTARSHLVGAAKHWLEGKREFYDWNEFEQAFRKTFVFENKKENKNDLWNHMQNRTQAKEENICIYYQEKVALCKSLNLPFAETKEQIAIGIFSDEIADFILSKHHEDVDDLFKDIVNYERINHARKKFGRNF